VSSVIDPGYIQGVTGGTDQTSHVNTLNSSEYISHGNCTLQLVRDDNVAVA